MPYKVIDPDTGAVIFRRTPEEQQMRRIGEDYGDLVKKNADLRRKYIELEKRCTELENKVNKLLEDKEQS